MNPISVTKVPDIFSDCFQARWKGVRIVSQDELHQHLSRISTMWTALFQAHRGSERAIASAQELLLERYSGAVYRYLWAVLGDPHAADELAQEFALRFLKGSFKGASPEKGRFRDYVKAVLFNLIRDHHKRQKRREQGLDLELHEPADDASTDGDVQEFLNGWREELLARTWEALAQYEKETGKLYHTTLNYRTRNSDTSSADMARVFTERFGRPFTAAGVRQTTHRAREKFGDFLVAEVARSLEATDTETIEQELIDLGLHSYCQDAVKRWAAAH
jgi:RNA polymerase sigma-70 factor (ECF subfamily)